MDGRTIINPDIEFIHFLNKNGGGTLKKCFQCATCSVVCSLSPQEGAFPRKEMIFASWGQKENLLSDPDIWLCHGCTDCSIYCPRGAKPADVLSAIRSYVIEFFAFPKFMGLALKNPKYLFLLLLVPVIILFGILYINLDGNFLQLNSGKIIFAKFFPHAILEVFFIGGNILIFFFAGIGLFKFWNHLKIYSPVNSKRGFPVVLIETMVEIVFHKKFNSCSTDSSRFWGHFFIFYGFIGAMATAGLALIADLLFGLAAPIPFFHPIKILGNLSGILMLIGCIIVINKRLKIEIRISSNTYNDWILIIFVSGIALTGLLTESMRLAEIPVLAYSMYFIHLVLIFFLLWYAPYSKMAHMFYRTLALVYLKKNNRDKR